MRFEKREISIKTISRYLYVAGIDVKTICHLYRLSKDEITELQTLPTIAKIKNELRTISAILYPLKSLCEEIDNKHENVNKILWQL